MIRKYDMDILHFPPPLTLQNPTTTISKGKTKNPWILSYNLLCLYRLRFCPQKKSAEMAANLSSPALLLHQPFLPARPTQRNAASIHFNGSSSTENRLLQRKLCRKFDGATSKGGRRDFQCKAQAQDNGMSRRSGLDQSKLQLVLASISSSGTETSSVGAGPPNPQYIPPPTPFIGSPLLWIGIGVGISALFSWVANSVKRYAMQQFFKNIMGQATPSSSQFGGMAMPAGSGFPIPPFPAPPETRFSSAQTVDVSATEVINQSTEANGVAEVKLGVAEEKVGAAEKKVEPKKPAFVDVSPEEVSNLNAYGVKQDTIENNAPKTTHFQDPTLPQGQTFTQADAGADSRSSQSTGNAGPTLTVEALEKMMEDPTVQKMVYPYLPQEMQNPDTFKWMMQNPQYRQQLEEMLKNMSGDATWDNQMLESLKNFDLNSQEVKQQFEQIGLTPEEVISKIMANPDVAMAFQNPRVQAAIMDCSQNPMSITKYQNDKEVMDVFNKISELFPGMTGSP